MQVFIPFGVLTALLLLSPAGGAYGSAEAPYLTALEAEILREMNLARTRPAGYAESLAERRKYYREKRFKRPREKAIFTHEGVTAVDEAIEFLRAVKPAGALRPSPGISRAARDHVLDQGPSGGLGHQGDDGSQTFDRVSRYGEWRGGLGENISYGQNDAREVVAQQIVDDGTPNRDHRKNIFDPLFRVVGVACGPHAEYGTMCVTTFAAVYEETIHRTIDVTPNPEQSNQTR